MWRSIVAFGSIIVLVLGLAPMQGSAHQAGGVEIGDLETGSVVGQPFKELPVDLELYTADLGNLKIIYPPTAVLDMKTRAGRPVVIKVTNKSTVDRGFLMTADGAFEAPTVLRAQLVLKPGETKYIGIPTSDLLYATSGSTFAYKDHLHPNEAGGKLMILR
ncbi:MAG: hypothetical protein KatS3mg082_1244 [Nitrospiraceae bacterium]|nr:MAG: hypothetical protein KatS3mg082_1244 [Nitrospiraceae bacterium]